MPSHPLCGDQEKMKIAEKHFNHMGTHLPVPHDGLAERGMIRPHLITIIDPRHIHDRGLSLVLFNRDQKFHFTMTICNTGALLIIRTSR